MIFFPMQLSSYCGPAGWKYFPFIELSCPLFENQLIIYAWMYFFTLFSVSLIFISSLCHCIFFATLLIILHQFLIFIYFLATACGILAPQPGIKPVLPAVEI